MRNIEIKILNPEVVVESEKMMVCSARLTQRGHNIKDMDSFMELYNRPYRDETVKTMISLPHPTIQKFGALNVVVVGASRRFLAQITRHQNEVKFMSASLQYSDYSASAGFCIPYSVIEKGPEYEENYLNACQKSMEAYTDATGDGIDNDAAGYMAPQGLRNVLIISATPYQWKHMIKQRTCNRNTKETQYVMLKIWEEFYNINPILFGNCGPFCTGEGCKEGKMCCGRPVPKTPKEILKKEFPLLYKEPEFEQLSFFEADNG